MKKRFCLVFILVLCCFMPTTLFAKSNDIHDLTIICPTSNMNVSLYRVADENYELTSKFSNYSIDLKHDVQGSANALENRILKDGIEEDAFVSSASSGKACFTGLMSGIYLVVGNEVQKNGVFYVPQVSLISLSGDLNIDLKYETNDKPVSLHVLKVWKMDSKKNRPSSIEVCLLRTDDLGNSVVVDKQVLSSENQWAYTWNDLSASYKYCVMETSVPAGYKESCSREKNTVILTNTGSYTNKVENKKDKELALTGQLWWPVPVLLFIGFVLFGLGCYLRNEN